MTSITLNKGTKKAKKFTFVETRPIYGKVNEIYKPHVPLYMPLDLTDYQKLANDVIDDSRLNTLPFIRKVDRNNFTINITATNIESLFEIVDYVRREQTRQDNKTMKITYKPYLLIERIEKIDGKEVVTFEPWYCGSNAFKTPFVLTRTTFEDFRNKILDTSFYDGIDFNKTGSPDRILGVFGFQIQMLVLGHTVKGDEIIPDYIINSANVYSFNDEKDSLCFFFCLVKCIYPSIRSDRMKTKVMVLYHELHKFLGIEAPNIDSYQGFNIDEHLHLIEEKYKFSISIWKSEKENTDKYPKAKLFRQGTFDNRKGYEKKNLLLYGNHIMWIKDFDAFFKLFICNTCGKQINTRHRLYNHELQCKNNTKYVYKYELANRTNINLLIKLSRKYNIPFDGDIKYPWYVTIDYESFFVESEKEKKKMNKDDQTHYLNEHIPSSVALASSPEIYNLNPTMKEYFNCVKNYLPDGKDITDDGIVGHCIQMNKDTFKHIFEIQKIISLEARKKWAVIEAGLLKRIEEFESLLKINKFTESYTKEEATIKKSLHGKYHQLCNDLNRFYGYCDQLPLLGFSSGRYDLGCSKLYGIFQALMELDELKFSGNKVYGMIRKGTNNFMQIQTEKILLLDLQSYIGPAVTLDKVFKDFLKVDAKETIPYELFKSIKVLDKNPFTVTKEDLKSELKDYSPEELDSLWDKWRGYIEKHSFKTMLEVLRHYNLCDVRPMIDVIKILQEKHYEYEFELLKDVGSLSKISNRVRQYMTMDKYVWSLQKEFKFEMTKNDEDKIEHNFESMKTESNESNEKTNKYYKIKQNNIIELEDILKTYEKQCHKCSICLKTLENNYCELHKEGIFYKPDNLHLLCLDCYKPFLLKSYTVYELRDKMIEDEWLSNNPMPMTIDDKDFHHDIDNHGIVGGLSTVFSRYHKIDETSIQKYKFDLDTEQFVKTTTWGDLSDESMIVRAIMAFDANALYAYCQLQPMPCDRKIRENTTNMNKFIPMLLKGDLYDWEEGLPFFFKIDAHIPKHLINKFMEFGPFIQKQVITYDMLTKEQQACWDKDKRPHSYKSVKIINKLIVKNQLYTYASVRWFIQNDIVIDKLHYVIHAKPRRIYEDFVQFCCQGRRDADINGNKIQGMMSKSWLTNSYGYNLLDKRKFKEDRMSSDLNQIRKWMESPHIQEMEYFEDLNGETVYLGNFTKKTIKCDTARDVGFTILDYSHLHMVRFVHDFLFKYMDREKVQLNTMDTDSMFASFASNNQEVITKMKQILEPIDCLGKTQKEIENETDIKIIQRRTLIDSFVKESMKEEYSKIRHLWLPNEDNYQYDKYTPGLFKLDGFFTELANNQPKS